MKNLVVDASVVIKWYDTEIQKEAALGILREAENGLRLWVPSLVFPEVGNILWKKCRRREMEEETALEIVQTFLASGVLVYPAENLLSPALEISLSAGRTVYDSIYVALAEMLAAKFVTADLRLVNGLSGTRWSEMVIELGRFADPG